MKTGIIVDSVSVAYGKNYGNVFNNLNIRICKGELVAVVGKSGIGKTTLIKLLSGLVQYSGSIKFDEQELKDFSTIDEKNIIGYLPQDVLLLPGSIAENISGLRKPDSEQVVKVAKLVGIHDFILKFPAGYDTQLTGGVQNLSGGERQRIGLARAVYNNPACLFLDEPNSALDHSGELALQHALKYSKEKGTIIVIVTHRRSVLSYADKILDLSDQNPIQLIQREDYIKQFKSKEEFDKKFTF